MLNSKKVSKISNTRSFQGLRPQGEEVAEIDFSPNAEARLKLLLDALKAVKQGDFSIRLSIENDGIITEIAKLFNDVVSNNEKMASEIVKVSKIVGEEGKLTERASPGSSAGSWKASMDSINALIDNLAQPTTEVGRVITAVAEGDLSKKMMLEIDGRPLKGEFSRIGTRVNTMVDQLSSFSSEVTRVAKEVGTEGKLGGQAEVKGVGGAAGAQSRRGNAAEKRDRIQAAGGRECRYG